MKKRASQVVNNTQTEFFVEKGAPEGAAALSLYDWWVENGNVLDKLYPTQNSANQLKYAALGFLTKAQKHPTFTNPANQKELEQRKFTELTKGLGITDNQAKKFLDDND